MLINTVTPKEFGWMPGANTIAYFPFENDILDQTGNMTLTHGNYSKQTLGYLITGQAQVTVSSNITIKTQIGWINIGGVGTTANPDFLINCTPDNCGYYYRHNNSALNQYYYSFYNSSFATDKTQVTTTTGTWYLFCTVNDVDNNKSYGYINGAKVFEGRLGYRFNNDGVFFWNFRDNTSITGDGTAILSKRILEDKARTAQEISNYYNNTKGNYGIS